MRTLLRKPRRAPAALDLDVLRRTMADLEASPAEARYRFGVTTAWRGGSRTESKVEPLTVGDRTMRRGFRFVTDEPSTLGGSDACANPQELLLGALNACLVFGYVAGAALRGIRLEILEIESRADLDLRGFLGLDPGIAPGLDTIRTTVRIRSDGTPAQLEEIHAAVRRSSPNYFTVREGLRFESDLVVMG